MSTTTGTRWYAIQTYSGHENKVQRLVQLKIDEGEGEGELLDVLVPTQEVVEIRNGKRVTVTRRLYPGYVLVHMALNERTSHAINNIQGVIKFVGSGKAPQPLREDEVNKILVGAHMDGLGSLSFWDSFRGLLNLNVLLVTEHAEVVHDFKSKLSSALLTELRLHDLASLDELVL